MERKIPSPENSLLFFMKEKSNPELYEHHMISLEKKIEEKLIEMFGDMNIHAIVKTDRYSLPYTNEIKTSQRGESYLNGAFESWDFKRKIFKEILNKDINKLRFYVFAEIEDYFPMGKVNYYFRYYPHKYPFEK